MLDKKDKAAIGGILITSLITNAVWIIMFLQHHAEWKKCYDELVAYCNANNDKWKKCYGELMAYCNEIIDKQHNICRGIEEDDGN